MAGVPKDNVSRPGADGAYIRIGREFHCRDAIRVARGKLRFVRDISKNERSIIEVFRSGGGNGYRQKRSIRTEASLVQSQQGIPVFQLARLQPVHGDFFRRRSNCHSRIIRTEAETPSPMIDHREFKGYFAAFNVFQYGR